jgi:hypothetical protein
MSMAKAFWTFANGLLLAMVAGDLHTRGSLVRQQTEIDESRGGVCLGEEGASEFSTNQKLWFV